MALPKRSISVSKGERVARAVATRVADLAALSPMCHNGSHEGGFAPGAYARLAATARWERTSGVGFAESSLPWRSECHANSDLPACCRVVWALQ